MFVHSKLKIAMFFVQTLDRFNMLFHSSRLQRRLCANSTYTVRYQRLQTVFCNVNSQFSHGVESTTARKVTFPERDLGKKPIDIYVHKQP